LETEFLLHVVQLHFPKHFPLSKFQVYVRVLRMLFLESVGKLCLTQQNLLWLFLRKVVYVEYGLGYGDEGKIVERVK
jgi:hypothetical protein